MLRYITYGVTVGETDQLRGYLNNMHIIILMYAPRAVDNMQLNLPMQRTTFYSMLFVSAYPRINYQPSKHFFIDEN